MIGGVLTRRRTFEEALDLGKFGRIVELSEILCLLGKIFALYRRIALIRDDVGRCVVEVLNQGGQVNVCQLSVSMDDSAQQEGIGTCDALLHADIAC